MRKNIGCVIIQAGENQKDILGLMNVIADADNINMSVFSLDYGTVLETIKKYTVYPLYEAKYYHGNVFSWDLITTDLVVRFPNIKTIFYYLNELPWMKSTNTSYKVWNNIFNNNKVQVFTDKPEIKQILDLTWNKNCKLINQVNAESLYEMLQQYE